MYRNNYLVLVRPTDERNTRYLLTEVEVTAKNWADAYDQVRAEGFIPFKDEYIPTPA